MWSPKQVDTSKGEKQREKDNQNFQEAKFPKISFRRKLQLFRKAR